MPSSAAAGSALISLHLSSYFGMLIELIYAHGGDVLKFAGDALICMFGDKHSTEPPEEITLRAVQCALQLQCDFAKYEPSDGISAAQRA